ncbi:MAG TPA: alkaline phosphatase family protein [Candidatus Sulfotelmatobacter sp.]|nr:alkaline phosphatase family protein [Candidatus Sulfotelmatobacter sp.]
MKRILMAIALLAACTGNVAAQEGAIPTGIPHLDHVFVIMMENHGYGEIINNPNAQYINQYARQSNLANNYFAVAHPSLTNYLEVVGGSNFGVQSDNPPDWYNGQCQPNLFTGIPNTDNPSSPAVCPIRGHGTDAATPALDCMNEVTGPPCEVNVDGKVSYSAVSTTLGITIADQLVTAGKSWKSYQENLPMTGARRVNYSDGNFTNNTNFAAFKPQLDPPLNSGEIVQLYAAKHNPFVYFQNVQLSTTPGLRMTNVVGFDGAGGLWSDLGSGNIPSYAFIAPNQCNDQHGRGNGTAFCGYDPNNNGTQSGLNPALIMLGDQAIQKIVTAIHASPAWTIGNNAIVVVWDENDYSLQPVNNRVMAIVDTNYGVHGVQSGAYYTHFSLLRSIEGGLGLPCLNHACDANTATMTDLFAAAQ